MYYLLFNKHLVKLSTYFENHLFPPAHLKKGLIFIRFNAILYSINKCEFIILLLR